MNNDPTNDTLALADRIEQAGAAPISIATEAADTLRELVNEFGIFRSECGQAVTENANLLERVAMLTKELAAKDTRVADLLASGAGIDGAPAQQGTPAARWRANGEANPHQGQYDCERAQLAHGKLTDDELANAVFMCDHRTSFESIGWLTAAKERIRWLSRALAAATAPKPAAPVQQITLTGNQLRQALDFINPDGPADELQCGDDLTFGVRQHQDDDGAVSTGMCCWNDDTDGEVLPLTDEWTAPAQPDQRQAQVPFNKRTIHGMARKFAVVTCDGGGNALGDKFTFAPGSLMAYIEDIGSFMQAQRDYCEDMDGAAITDTDRIDHIATKHVMGAPYGGMVPLHTIVHGDDYAAGGVRHAIDCMIERETGRSAPAPAIQQAPSATLQRITTIPSGWRIDRFNGGLIIQNPGVDAYFAEHDPDNIASLILFHLASDMLAQATPATIKQGPPAKVDDAARSDADRAKGRAEALGILMGLDPDVGTDEYIDWHNSGATEDEGSALWNADKLRELLHVDSALADMQDKAEGEYWHNLVLRKEAERIYAAASLAHKNLRDAVGAAIHAEIQKNAPNPDWIDSRKIDLLADAAMLVLLKRATYGQHERKEITLKAARWQYWKQWWMHSEDDSAQLPECVVALMADLDLDEAMDTAIAILGNAK